MECVACHIYSTGKLRLIESLPAKEFLFRLLSVWYVYNGTMNYSSIVMRRYVYVYALSKIG